MSQEIPIIYHEFIFLQKKLNPKERKYEKEKYYDFFYNSTIVITSVP